MPLCFAGELSKAVFNSKYRDNAHAIEKAGGVPIILPFTPDLDILRAMAEKMPVLAICRGLQVVNVALGGTLFQDIYTQAPGPVRKHTQDMISFDTDHEIDIAPGSRLHGIFGDRIPVNSRHHQAIDSLGEGLVITARSPDGIIEAAEHQILPMDLVQWHPELMLQKNDAMLPLFKSFVDRC